MSNLLWISVVSMTVYLFWYFRKYGMTGSISATFKGLQGQEQVLFPLTLCLTSVPLMVVGMAKAPTTFPQLLFFLSGMLIIMVAASPVYWKGGIEKWMHYIGSYGGIGLGMVASLLAFTSFSTILVFLLYALFVVSQMFLKWRYKVNNHIYWIEVAAIVLSAALIYFN